MKGEHQITIHWSSSGSSSDISRHTGIAWHNNAPKFGQEAAAGCSKFMKATQAPVQFWKRPGSYRRSIELIQLSYHGIQKINHQSLFKFGLKSSEFPFVGPKNTSFSLRSPEDRSLVSDSSVDPFIGWKTYGKRWENRRETMGDLKKRWEDGKIWENGLEDLLVRKKKKLEHIY